MNPKYTNSVRYKCLEYLKKHSVDLYLSYCGMEVCDPGHFYGPISRSEYLIHYIIDGKGIFKADGKTYHLAKHDTFLIYPGETTYYQADFDDPWTYIWIGFGGVKAEACLTHACFGQKSRIVKFHHEDKLIDCVKEMLNSSQLTYSNDLKREAFLFMFLANLIDEKNETSFQNGAHDYPYQVYVEHALEFIDHNYHRDIKVNDIANYIGIDRSYFTNIFKKSMHISPQQYIINYRMAKACYLLKTTSLPISAISHNVGYPDPLTFSKVFKILHQVSPKAFREQSDELDHSDLKGK